MIHVVGGCYNEICLSPEVTQFYGSAGRAAAALAARTTDVTLHTYAAGSAERKIRRLAALSNIKVATYPAVAEVTFGYVHPLYSLRMSPDRDALIAAAPMRVDAGDGTALLFGAVEGLASAEAGVIVYDPQNGGTPAPFSKTGSKARRRLAILLNAAEASRLAGADDIGAAGRAIRDAEGADVVIIKAGPQGAFVFEKGAEDPIQIPPYRSQTMFGIGSGDMYAAAFTWFWGERSEVAVDAADLASRAVSHYVETRDEKLADDGELADRTPLSPQPGRVYLAGPFFNMAQRWLIEEARGALRSSGLKVFSPIHDVGRGSAVEVASKDLAGLESCDRVFAILDGVDSGTVFEVGYARKLGLPVYAYAEALVGEDATMITGSGCEVIRDFATAIYKTAWKL